MKRVAIIGDVGGHLLQLKEQLWALEVDTDVHVIPDELTICQVGDLVHKGPDSTAIVALVDQLMTSNPGRWVQLVGNHETQYLEGGTQFWMESVDLATAQTLRRWWASGDLRVAAGFELAATDDADSAVGASPGGSLLVTHAGLTAGAWRLLGSLATVTEIVTELNRAQAPVIWREGEIITGTTDLSAGPIWAIAATEVYVSWAAFDGRMAARKMPTMTQAHGHTSARSWRKGQWYPPIDLLAAQGKAILGADDQRKITQVDVGRQRFFGCDPESGRSPMSVTTPLTLRIASIS